MSQFKTLEEAVAHVRSEYHHPAAGAVALVAATLIAASMTSPDYASVIDPDDALNKAMTLYDGANRLLGEKDDEFATELLEDA